jgi:3-oxoacyl-[acyl-carrier protein] reductase
VETGLTGKVVVITGAGGGMGRVIARKFAAERARLLLVDMAPPDLAELVGGADVESMAANLAASGAAAAIVDKAVDRFGTIDILVNGAGVVRLGLIEAFTPDDWDAMLDVNLKATFFLSQAVGRVMAGAGGGRIVNLASIGGTTATPGNTIYGISKAGVIALTAQFAVEWGPRGITCNAVAPGMMTNLMQGIPHRDEEAHRHQAARIPTRRSGTPEDIADAVVFLASDAARQINGQTLVVDGGLTKSVFDLYQRVPRTP